MRLFNTAIPDDVLEHKINEEVIKQLKKAGVYDLKSFIGDVVTALLEGKPDNDMWLKNYWTDPVDIRNKFQMALENAAAERATLVARIEINKHINNEAFIDSVVDRIKSKQLA
jgi:hypothetical protein